MTLLSFKISKTKNKNYSITDDLCLKITFNGLQELSAKITALQDKCDSLKTSFLSVMKLPALLILV